MGFSMYLRATLWAPLLGVACLLSASSVRADSRGFAPRRPPISEWVIAGPPAPVNNVPTNGYVLLGLQLVDEFCFNTPADGLSALQVSVTADVAGTTTEVPGSLSVKFRDQAAWTPDAAFLSDTTYSVTVVVNNLQLQETCGCCSNDFAREFDFVTGSEPAGGAPATQPFVSTLTELSCGLTELQVRFGLSEDHPYVRYSAVDEGNVQHTVSLVQENYQVVVSGATESTCLTITATHSLSNETETHQVCAAQASKASLCNEGCAAGGTTEGWPMAAALVAGLGWWLRRRRSSPLGMHTQYTM